MKDLRNGAAPQSPSWAKKTSVQPVAILKQTDT